MRERNYALLVGIIFIALVAGWIVLPDNPGLRVGPFTKEIKVHEGLDLQGGLQVLLQADVTDCASVTTEAMDSAKLIVEKRVNALGVAEPLIQRQGQCRIVAELPGLADPDAAIRTFGNTGLLEFIDAGDTPLAEGQLVQTTGLSTVVLPGQPLPTPSPRPTVAAAATITATGGTTTTAPITATTPITPVYRTVMTGRELRSSSVAFEQTTNSPYIQFTLTDDGAKIFGDYTTKNVNKYLAISIDKHIISSPVIKSAITEGSGIIEG
ncbi:partial Protein translocase subunit SecDF, partial [Anaerolineae bacterium]